MCHTADESGLGKALCFRDSASVFTHMARRAHLPALQAAARGFFLSECQLGCQAVLLYQLPVATKAALRSWKLDLFPNIAATLKPVFCPQSRFLGGDPLADITCTALNSAPYHHLHLRHAQPGVHQLQPCFMWKAALRGRELSLPWGLVLTALHTLLQDKPEDNALSGSSTAHWRISKHIHGFLASQLPRVRSRDIISIFKMGKLRHRAIM